MARKPQTSPAQLFILRLKDLKAVVGSGWLGTYASVDSGTISRWFTGKTMPSDESMLKVEKSLRHSLSMVTTHQKALQNAVPTFTPCVDAK